MTRKSKREIERTIEEAKSEAGLSRPDGPTEIVFTDRVVSTEGEDLGVSQKLRIHWDPEDGWQSEELSVDPEEAAPSRGDR